jgi:hypothetical protein
MLTVPLLAPNCTVPALNLANKIGDASADSGVPVNLCQSIPRFTGTQVVDGYDDDLMSLPDVLYPWGTLLTSGGGIAMGDHLDVDARVGWSELALHVFIHVHYETGHVIAPSATDLLWYGDAVELFLKGDSNLTGAYDGGADPGATQIVASPDATNPPRSEMYNNYGMGMLGPLPSGSVAAHIDGNDYALEFMIPWTLVVASHEATPTAGSSIGFDFGVDYRWRGIDAGTNEPEYQLLLSLRSVGSTPCPTTTPIPSCDDRLWCTPTLSPSP